MSETQRKQLKASNSKSLMKKDKNAEIERIFDEKVRDVIFNTTSGIAGNPDLLIEEFKVALKKINAGKGKKKPATIKKETERATAMMMKVEMAYGLENHFPLLQLSAKKHTPLIIEFAKKLTAEYDCKMPSERALVQVIVIAYAKILEFTERLSDNLNADDPWISHEKNGLKSVLGKELDRANRRFITALAMLKQIKSPAIEINIKAKTAFVSQNQQINATQNFNNKEDEIITPK